MNNQALLHIIHEFIRHLLSAVASAGLYGMDHQQVTRLSDVAFTSLNQVLTLRSDFAILEVEGELIVDREPLPFSIVMIRFSQYLRENGIGHIRFIAGVSSSELNQFIAAFAHQSDIPEICSTDHIRVGRVEMAEHDGTSGKASSVDSDSGAAVVALNELPALELARLTEVFEAVKRKERLKPSGIAATVAELVEAFKREGEAILVLAAIREKDEYNFTHAANVCILTMAQATSLGIHGQLLNDICMAAMLHDIGKMFVPEDILAKEEKLNDEEFALMKTHPVRGGRYLQETPGVPRLAAIVAYEHHMRDNLSGYPAAPPGWKLNLASQLTAIADVFDAMRTRRSYQEPHSPHVIVNLLLSKTGTEFNPLLVGNFLQILSRLNKI